MMRPPNKLGGWKGRQLIEAMVDDTNDTDTNNTQLVSIIVSDTPQDVMNGSDQSIDKSIGAR